MALRKRQQHKSFIVATARSEKAEQRRIYIINRGRKSRMQRQKTTAAAASLRQLLLCVKGREKGRILKTRKREREKRWSRHVHDDDEDDVHISLALQTF